MTAFLADCFPFLSRRAAASRSVAWSDAQTVQLIDGQTEQARSTDALFKPGCVFCDVSVHKGFRVVDETDKLIAFQDRNPGAQHHYLVIPKRHIDNVKTLTERDVPLLTEMERFGNSLLSKYDLPPTSRRLGYHIPPFNSIQHLHLHVLSLPLKSRYREFKYRDTSIGPSQRDGKKWGWFVASVDARRILMSGGRIKVGSIRLPRSS